MKKFAKWMGALAVLACLCLTMVACGGSETGKYKCSETFEEEGFKYTVESVIELKKDNKVTMTYTFKSDEGTESESEDGTYEVKDGKITIKLYEDGELVETMTGTFKKGKSITFEEKDEETGETMKTVFKK